MLLLVLVSTGVIAGAAVLVGAAAFLLVSSDLAQANTKRPVKIHNIRRRDLDILVLPGDRVAERRR